MVLDTTMEFQDLEIATPSPSTNTNNNNNTAQEDEEFVFNAPSYYDLKNPALEVQYVNNADGYFSSPAPTTITKRLQFSASEVDSPTSAESTFTPPPPLPSAFQSSFNGFSSSSTTTASTTTAGVFKGNQSDTSQPSALDHNELQPQGVDNQQDADMDEHMSDGGLDDTMVLDTTMVMEEVQDDNSVPPLATQSPTSSTAQAHATNSPPPTPLSLSRSLTKERDETFEQVFARYASSSQSSISSLLGQDSGAKTTTDYDTNTPATSHYSPHSSHHSSQQSLSPRRSASARSLSNQAERGLPLPPPQSAENHHSAYAGVSSKLLYPTQSFLRKIQADQAMRERNYMEDMASMEEKPRGLTKPKSPRLRTRQKAEQQAHNSNDLSRMSSTSRELLQIQEEKLRLQMEALKIREFHEKTKAQRLPSNVHQRSTKQLTIPQSPQLAVDQRARLSHRDEHNQLHTTATAPHPFIPPETLLSREFPLPAVPHPINKLDHTIPQSPQLQTAARATRCGNLPPPRPEKPVSVDYCHTKVGGLTKPVTPQLETLKRAQVSAAYRKPIEVVDKDQEELAKKFHAKPVNRKILEPKVDRPPINSSSRPTLTKPVSPKLSTSSRSTFRQSAAERAAAVAAEVEQRRKEREQQRLKARSGTQSAPMPRRPLIPETPPLKSIQRHREYQENFRRRQEQEQQELEKQRKFKANPMRITTPPMFEGSRKPLTEVVPFSLPGEQYHERARERVEMMRREEEEKLKHATQFKAMPMPVVHDPQHQENTAGRFQVKPSSKPLTRFAAPVLASDRRAAERAAFDAAERERRAHEEAYKREMEEEAKRLEEEELKRIRREKLTFHARPLPEPTVFELKPTTKSLTEPMSPMLHYHRSGGRMSD